MSTPSLPFSPRRVAVVGTTGSGKTTLAQALAGRLELPHVELDALFWGPGWSKAPEEVFRQRLEQALAGPAWVVDGNYSMVRDIVWGRAQALVWLDFSLPVILWRLLLRTVARTLRRDLLWGTNRETWRDAFFSRDSLIVYAFTSRRKFHRSYPAALASPAYAHLSVFRLRSPRQADQFLANLHPEARSLAGGDSPQRY